jgi:uncharacterized membrane protein YsdA (DUF1294 family)
MPDLLTYLQTPAGLAAALIVINAGTFALFGIDKNRALAGQWRIAEGTLLLLALLGGTLGAYLGRAGFRHKTRKQPFSALLHTIAAVQAGGLVAWAGGWLG